MSAAPHPTHAKSGWVGVTLCALLAFALLVGLGLWQLARLHWKEDLLARMHARISAPVVELPAASQWASWQADEYDYLHVRVSGIFEHAKEVRIFASAGHVGRDIAQPGYLIITPLRLDDGHVLLVNRGFVPLALELPSSRPQSLIAGRQTLTGLLRAPEPRNLFTPADEPQKRLWFTRDPASIATALGLAQATPFSLDADKGADPAALPAGGATVISIPNNHFAYAWTWFGLAGTLVGVYGAFMRRRLRKS